jgi:hypothetical protein
MPAQWFINLYTAKSSTKLFLRCKYYDHQISKLTSAHALGRTNRPMRPASLALRTFSNNGTMVEFGLEDKMVKDITIKLSENLKILKA